ECGEILRERMDKLMRNMEVNHRDFYEIYNNAREVVDNKGRRKAVAGEAPYGIINGTVSENIYGNGLEGVLVKLENTATGKVLEDYTDEDAEYYFEKVEPGSYILRVVFDGYNDLIIANFKVAGNEELTKDFELVKIGTESDTDNDTPVE
ncbi:MAG: carboxypeptidase-like regulatory domain-containing protein, partial [Bacteroidota bacterium]